MPPHQKNKTKQNIKQKQCYNKFNKDLKKKRKKDLGINLHEEVRDLYLENYKTLMKETKDDTNR